MVFAPLPAVKTGGGRYFRFSHVYLVFGWMRGDSWVTSEQLREICALEMPQSRAFKLTMPTGTNKISQMKFFQFSRDEGRHWRRRASVIAAKQTVLAYFVVLPKDGATRQTRRLLTLAKMPRQRRLDRLTMTDANRAFRTSVNAGWHGALGKNPWMPKQDGQNNKKLGVIGTSVALKEA